MFLNSGGCSVASARVGCCAYRGKNTKCVGRLLFRSKVRCGGFVFRASADGNDPCFRVSKQKYFLV